ncbi:hypothetical protein TPHA_0F00860 [Tetrapisispora phaffii CBS 4417]|uniref:Peroxin/Ferlin domain-containing protein n=1 Tax=Tetrapisispora phaffii (strain ATCC 24235 / CBS 4417 / NBRC 1672 / NRRL Y-8282 / UCD 70-5) TaxID=1071381 RepID=G8BUZ0_TETPH|nr:hypothetical protein TPHA_0F00860 [Tetrapisispora phaffii CBS 4417]CCE63572.1 hypothetical protein TPHA_0F00860 [Tetrapisispora phaffii CBS 4417]
MSEPDSKVKKDEVRAHFVEPSIPRIGGETTKVIKSALKKHSTLKITGDRQKNTDYNSESTVVSSPLLSSTPSTVSKSLLKIYPYLILADFFLSVLTWTNENIWSSILTVLIYTFTVLYFQIITRYFGHVVIVGLLWSYSLLDEHIEERMISKPTLDDIVHTMDKVTKKFDLLLSPITLLSAQDVKRLLFTTIFLSPLYICITVFIFSTKNVFLLMGIYMLTYQSPWAKIARRILWKFKVVRLMVFYATGLDLGGINNHQGILDAVHNQVKKLSNSNYNSTANSGMGLDRNGKQYTQSSFSDRNGKATDSSHDSEKPIRFTYVLYENQRRWIGIGWTSSMLSYERTPWTDEFLNPAPSPDEFTLPEEDSHLKWKWIDKSWRLDMTNDGAIQLSSSKPRTSASPTADASFIYYDNTWKKPSTQDSFSKYTRRRRWVRTAELIKTHSDDMMMPSENTINTTAEETELESNSPVNDKENGKKVRNVTINEEPIIMGEDKVTKQPSKSNDGKKDVSNDDSTKNADNTPSSSNPTLNTSNSDADLTGIEAIPDTKENENFNEERASLKESKKDK